MKVLITGSTGFVGSRLMWELEQLGHQVVGIDKKKECAIKSHPATVFGNLLSREDLCRIDQSSLDLIIHCAAEKHDFGLTREEYYLNNLQATVELCDWATNVNRMIYVSTVGVYGHQVKPCDEDGELRPNHYYGASKLEGENAVKEWMEKVPGREVIFLRPSIIYGPYNSANMYNLIDMLHRRPWATIDEGSHVKSMVSLSNFIDMIIFAIDRLKPGLEIYNCIDKPYITVRQLMQLIASNKGFRYPAFKIPYGLAYSVGKIFDVLGKILNKDLPINSERMYKLNTATFYYSEKIREAGYVQRYTIEEEIAKTCQWYLKHNNITL